MFSECRNSFVALIVISCSIWNSLLFSQEVPKQITPDVRYSPSVKIFNFTNYFGIEDGKYYLNFELTIPKDGSYEVTTFSATTVFDDTDTVLRSYGVDGYSGSPVAENDNFNPDTLFSKISIESCLKGEKYYFRVLPKNAIQNDRSFGICYECKKITEPKKFLIGMYTMDYDIPATWSFHSTVNNPTKTGHEDIYYKSLKDDNFNFIIPWNQLVLPDLQKVPTTYPDRGFLDRALANGIDVVITAPMVNYYRYKCTDVWPHPFLTDRPYIVPFDKDTCEQTIKYFDGHPAIIGYHVMDEPSYKIDNEEGMDARTFDFDRIDSVNNTITSNSFKKNYVGLKVPYGPKQYHWSGEYTNYPKGYYTQNEYINEQLNPFINQCNPDYIVIGYYLFIEGEGGDSTNARINFFNNYHLLASKATLSDKDFMPVLSFNRTWNDHTSILDVKELDYSIYATIFHGAHGFSYFTREFSNRPTSPNSLYNNVYDDHVPADTKLHLRELHGMFINKSDILVDLRYKSSYHYSTQSTIWSGYNENLPPECLWSEFKNNLTAQKYFDTSTPFVHNSGSQVENLAISFLTDSEGSDYFWIFNKSFLDSGVTFKINFSNLVNLTDVFSGENSDCVYKDVRLNACEAKLFRINRSFEINGIVRIPSGLTLPIKSGELLNFFGGSELIVEDGGNFILEEGANIQINGSAKIQGNAQINSGANVRISDKSSLNLQLSQLTIHSNTDIEIGKSAKLIIANGTNFIAEQGSVFIVDESSEIVVSTKGYFTATGTTFSYIGDTGKWLGINCTGGSSVDLNNIDINEAETGVKGIYNYKFNVRNSVFTGCDNGISVAELVPNVNYNITGNTLTGTKNGTGISITSSNGVFENNDISFFLYGTRLTMCSPVLKRNKIWGNKVFGILVSGQNAIPQLINTDTNQLLFLNNEVVSNGNTYWNPSSIFLSAQIGIIPYSSIYMHNGKNHIYSGLFNSTPIIPCISVANMISSANQNIVIDAENNYWGSSTVNDDFFFEEHSQYSIDYTPYYISPDGAIDPDNPASQSTTVENKLISNAIRLESLENNTPAIKLYEHIIKKYVDSPEYYIAMARLPYLYAKEELDNTQLITLYDEALQSVETSNKKFFKGMKVATHIKGKRYDDAIFIAEEMKTEAEFEEEVILADINIAIANLLKNMESKGRSEGDDTSDLMNLLNKLNGTQENGTPEEVADAIALPSGVSLYQNYPNPFNPVTQIRFDLAKTSDVKLRVYNVSGQVVSELADGVMNAGSHTVDFDGSRLNSGVYYYTLEVNGKSYTQKMILMK
jgi:hypothetical protein